MAEFNRAGKVSANRGVSKISERKSFGGKLRPAELRKAFKPGTISDKNHESENQK